MDTRQCGLFSHVELGSHIIAANLGFLVELQVCGEARVIFKSTLLFVTRAKLISK